jgi:hypothetical protein
MAMNKYIVAISGMPFGIAPTIKTARKTAREMGLSREKGGWGFDPASVEVFLNKREYWLAADCTVVAGPFSSYEEAHNSRFLAEQNAGCQLEITEWDEYLFGPR